MIDYCETKQGLPCFCVSVDRQAFDGCARTPVSPQVTRRPWKRKENKHTKKKLPVACCLIAKFKSAGNSALPVVL